MSSGPTTGPTPGSVYGLAGKTPQQQARIVRAEALAEAVFGTRRQAGAWIYSYTLHVAGGRVLPIKAAESEAGYAEVVAELERLRPRAAPLPLRRTEAPRQMRRRRLA